MRPPRVSGTVTLLRVDDAWRGLGNERSIYDIGDGYDKRGPRYVPLRYKADVGGLDGSDRIVTEDDFVTISLSSGFIKYFKELGGSKRRGEIALVVSFDAGGVRWRTCSSTRQKDKPWGRIFHLTTGRCWVR